MIQVLERKELLVLEMASFGHHGVYALIRIIIFTWLTCQTTDSRSLIRLEDSSDGGDMTILVILDGIFPGPKQMEALTLETVSFGFRMM